MHVNIPFGHLKTEAVLVELSGVYLTLKPAPPNSFEKAAKEDPKKKKTKRPTKLKKEPSVKKIGNFNPIGNIVESLKQRIMNEVIECALSAAQKFRLRFENIHIRFESGTPGGTIIDVEKLHVRRPATHYFVMVCNMHLGVAVGVTLQAFEINPSSLDLAQERSERKEKVAGGGNVHRNISHLNWLVSVPLNE